MDVLKNEVNTPTNTPPFAVCCNAMRKASTSLVKPVQITNVYTYWDIAQRFCNRNFTAFTYVHVPNFDRYLITDLPVTKSTITLVYQVCMRLLEYPVQIVRSNIQQSQALLAFWHVFTTIYRFVVILDVHERSVPSLILSQAFQARKKLIYSRHVGIYS